MRKQQQQQQTIAMEEGQQHQDDQKIISLEKRRNDIDQNSIILERLHVMLKQEESTYCCNDYYYSTDDAEPQQQEEQQQQKQHSNELNNDEEIRKSKILRSPSVMSVVDECTKATTNATSSSRLSNSINTFANNNKRSRKVKNTNWITWRYQMCQWAYSVSTTFGICRMTIAIAFDLLDRYIDQRYNNNKTQEKNSNDELTCRDFQLLTMSCFYVAAKANHITAATAASPTASITMEEMVDMSRGMFTRNDFQSTERLILQQLNWRISPPTSYHFVLEYLTLWKQLFYNKKRRSKPSSIKKVSGCRCSTCHPNSNFCSSSSLLDHWMIRSFYYLEVALADAYFVKYSSSQIAISAMLVAGNEYNIPHMDELYEFIRKERSLITNQRPSKEEAAEDIRAMYDRFHCYHNGNSLKREEEEEERDAASTTCATTQYSNANYYYEQQQHYNSSYSDDYYYSQNQSYYGY